ncbi:nucleoside hydrolase [Eremococcus coleocola]|uniref:nucleoside hydrolase n=1 Tax=Eremococcus coleocola TaxID=88132 RepID=UPI0003FD1714|nr:nucleoside hydrolase [Eremococcus coleocola]
MRKVYLNHDGGVDDLVSLYLLLQMDQVELIGVGVIPADCYLLPAVSASQKIIQRFSKRLDLKVAASNSRGLNPFPTEWRMHAYYVDALPVLNEDLPLKVGLSDLPAHQDLIRALKESDQKVDLVFVGPLTDLARALDQAPEIETKINKLIWMGGTFLADGNVHESDHDGSAEWNAYWDPQATKRVWNSSIEIDLVALESTNKVPLTIDIREGWAKQRSYIGMDFLGQCYAMVPPLVHFATNSTYYLWDVLTTLTLVNDSMIQKKVVYSTVHDQGPSQGRTQVDPQGRPVNLVYDVDHDTFFQEIEHLAKKSY